MADEPGWLSQYSDWLRTGGSDLDFRQLQHFFSSPPHPQGRGENIMYLIFDSEVSRA